MKIAIVGSRDFRNFDMVNTYVNSLPDDTVIVSGGARGVDTCAEIAAKKRGLRTIIHPADWNKHGKKAGFLRNSDIVNDADKVVAFWDGKSRGTKHSIDLANIRGKQLEIIR